MALFTGAQHLCTFNTVSLFITFCQKFGRRSTPSARPYLLMFRIDRPTARVSCVVPGPSQWFFHFGEEIVIARTHIGWVRWLFQNLPLPREQEIRDSSSGGVTPCLVMKNDRVLYHASRSPWKESSVLRSRATSILIQERCSNFVKMVLGRWHYPYESQRSTHGKRLTEDCRRRLH